MRTLLFFDELKGFDDIFMGEKSVLRSLFGSVPYDDALIVGGAGHELIIFRNDDIPNPCFMPNKCFFTVPCAYLPKLDGFISRTRDETVAIVQECHKWNVMIMAE